MVPHRFKYRFCLFSAMNAYVLDFSCLYGARVFWLLLWTHLWRVLILKILSVVREFMNVFPDELLDFRRLERLNFGIELIPRADLSQ
ncbi:hypothetical protein Tco_0453140 [Tanacetum coccineum]